MGGLCCHLLPQGSVSKSPSQYNARKCDGHPSTTMSIYFVRNMLWKDMLLLIFNNTLWKENIFFLQALPGKSSQTSVFPSKSIAAAKVY